jgi:two-component system sensor kinase FixL
VDEEGRILTFNKACERLFGYAAADIAGSDARLLVAPEHLSEHDACFAAARRGGRHFVGAGREVLGVHRDGTRIPLELAVGEVVTPAGRQFIGALRDLRRRRENQQRFTQLQADMLRMARISAIDEMGAALAHELNQPLTALMLYLQAINRANGRHGDGTALSPIIGDILDKALREAERAGTIIQRMRHFVEKHEPTRRLVDLTPLVEDAVELTLLGSRSGTVVTRKLATNLPGVIVDPIQIQQVVVNLLRNAVEAVKDVGGPDVRVQTRLTDGAVALTVSDNGPGIQPEAVPDLFKAFSTTGGGMALGLAISKTIAQTHGGDLRFEPGDDGHGANFTLTLPLPAPTDNERLAHEGHDDHGSSSYPGR